MGRISNSKNKMYRWTKCFVIFVFAFALLFPMPREVRSQPVAEYSQLSALIAVALAAGLINITNNGKVRAYTKLMALAVDNTEAASDGFQSGNTSGEISKNSAANGNLQGAQQMLNPDDAESRRLITEAQAGLSTLRAAALERLVAGEDLCGNGVLDASEECDNSSGRISCPDGSRCLEECTCEELR